MNQTDGQKVQLKISYRNKINNYEVPLSITIKDLKEIIQKKEEVCAVDQKLMFKGEVLEDSKQLYEFSIGHDDTLHVQLNEKKITVEFQDKNRKTHINNALNSHSMQQIKQIALKDFELPTEETNLAVFCDEKEVPDQMTLSEIKLPSNGVLHLKKYEKKRRVVVTDRTHDVSITRDVDLTETIWNLKVIIHKELEAKKNDLKLLQGVKIEPRLFTLTSGHRILEDDQNIEDCKIPTETTITLTIASMVVYVQEENREPYMIQCEPQYSIANIKKIIALTSKKHKEHDITLLSEERILDDKNTLDFYEIKDNSILTLTLEVKLKLKRGADTKTVTILDFKTFEQVKTQLHEELALLKNQHVNLTFEDKRLQDEEKISKYNFNENSEIQYLISFPLLLKTIEGKNLEVHVESDEYIWSVKDKIASKQGLTRDTIRLNNSKEELNDDKKVYDYGIQAETSLHVTYREIEVIICGIISDEMLYGKRIEIKVLGTDKIEKLRSKVSEKIKIPGENFDLVYNTIQLKDDQIIEKSGLDQNALVHFLPKNLHPKSSKQLLRIYIKSYDGQIITVEVEPTESVGDLKKKIETSLNIRAGQQTLVHAGRVLNDPKIKLSQNNIQSETTIFLYKLPNMIEIIVDSSDGKKLSVDVLKNDTILSIKKLLLEKYEIELEEQTLSKDGKKLEDAKSLKDYGLSDRSIVSLVIKTECDIIVKSLKGNSIRVKVQLKNKVGSLKSTVETEWKIPSGKQRLFFNGKVMDLNQTFFAYEPVKDSIIYVVQTASATIMFWKNTGNRIFVQQISLSDTVKTLQNKMAESNGIFVTELGPLSIAFDGKIGNVESIPSGSMVAFLV